MKDFVFIDVETSGLDPERHEILEVAALRVSPKLDVIGEFSAKCIPLHISNADPAALTVNGYTDEEWMDAIPLKEALVQTAPLMEDAVPAGHNVQFDLSFLAKGFAATGVKPPKTSRQRLDTVALAFVEAIAGKAPDMKLDSLCKALFVSRRRPHDARSDALDALESVRTMARLVAASSSGMDCLGSDNERGPK